MFLAIRISKTPINDDHAGRRKGKRAIGRLNNHNERTYKSRGSLVRWGSHTA